MAKGKGKRRGSIRQRKDGRYEARATIGYKPDGKPIQRSVYADTWDEAEKGLTELLLKHDKGLLTDPSKMTVAECLERYIANKVNADEGTRYKDRCEVKPLAEILGKRRLQDLRTPHVRDAYTALARKGLSVRAQSRAAMHLRAALREAVHEGTVIRNVADGVKVSTPRVDKEDEAARAWTPSEVNTFLDAANADPLYTLFYVMLSLGLRRGEALGLSWSAVDLEGGTLRVLQALSPKGRGATFTLKPVKTLNSRRTLYLGQDVLALLKVHKERQEEARAFMGSGWQGTSLVFTTGLGTPVSPRNALRSFKRLIAPLAVTPIRLHDLRHTYASLALQRGLPIEVVSERLGHARVDITLNIYRHLYEVERKEAALSLSDLLGTSGLYRTPS